MTYYEIWQLEKYGNILQESNGTDEKPPAEIIEDWFFNEANIRDNEDL